MAATTRKRNARKAKETVEITEEDRKPGVIYIGHLPHGFYENELKAYFTQFGKVLSVKVSRSPKSGNAKGYAFVKFRYAAVAKTVAETCQNYLFFNKLLKCQYRPLRDMHPKTFVTYQWKPSLKRKRQHNNDKSSSQLNSSLKVTTKRQEAKLKKLKELGLDLKLSDIVDVPTPKVQPAATPQTEVAEVKSAPSKRKRSTQKKIKSAPEKEIKSPTQQEIKAPPQKKIKALPQKEITSSPQKEILSPPQKEIKAPPKKKVKALPQKEITSPPQKEIKAPPQKKMKALPQKKIKAPPQKEIKSPPQKRLKSMRVVNKRKSLNSKK